MREKELATNIANALNAFGFKGKDFCEAMGREHRTLQQSFTRLCIDWLRYCGDLEEWQYDGRNEASVIVGKIVSEALNERDINNVPLI